MIAYSYVFILLTLAAGYTSLKLSHITKYRIIRYSGQELFFSSAVTGIFVFLIGYLICKSTEANYINLFNWYSDFFADKSIMYVATGWAMSFPLILFGLNNVFTNDTSISRFIEDQNDGIERILKISELNTKPIIVTLSSGKIYIGLVVQSFFSPVENRSFTLIPLLSGYRNQQTQELQITNNYVDLITEFPEKSKEFDINDFIVAIPIDIIVSTSLFSFEVYEELQPENVDDSDDYF